jgi:hypothetical protein
MKTIDIEEFPELVRLVEEIEQTHEPLVLRRGGEGVAVIAPLSGDETTVSESDEATTARQALRRSAGGWHGLVDAEHLQADNRQSRDILHCSIAGS